MLSSIYSIVIGEFRTSLPLFPDIILKEVAREAAVSRLLRNYLHAATTKTTNFGKSFGCPPSRSSERNSRLIWKSWRTQSSMLHQRPLPECNSGLFGALIHVSWKLYLPARDIPEWFLIYNWNKADYYEILAVNPSTPLFPWASDESQPTAIMDMEKLKKMQQSVRIGKWASLKGSQSVHLAVKGFLQLNSRNRLDAAVS